MKQLKQVEDVTIEAQLRHILDQRNTTACDPVYFEAEAAPVVFQVTRHGYTKTVQYNGVKAEGETREEALSTLQIGIRMMCRHDGMPEELVERIQVVPSLTQEEEQAEHVKAMAQIVLGIPDLDERKGVILSPERVRLAMNAVYKLGFDAARTRRKKEQNTDKIA